MIKKPLFESVPCPRCGGSGEYSFNLMHGSRCYGCSGSGYKLTKRGAAAQKYINSLRSVPVEQIKVGDLILFDMFFQKAFLRVEKIEDDSLNGGGRKNITTTRNGESWSLGTIPGQMIRLGFSSEEKAAQQQKALVYQATLGESGEPMKPTLPAINKAIAALGIKAELVKGKGYFYFFGESVETCPQQGVYGVAKVGDLTVEQWLGELKTIMENKA